MEALILVVRLSLVAVFLASGAAKLIDRKAFARSLAEFGLPLPLIPPVSVTLPLFEVGIGATLLADDVAWWAAIAGACLLAVFVGVIGWNLRRGRKPSCRCFGAIGSGPVGRTTVARNTALLFAAGLLVAEQPGRIGNAVSWTTTLTWRDGVALALVVVGLAVLAAQSWLMFQLLAQSGRLLSRLDALEGRIGTVAWHPQNTSNHGLLIGQEGPALIVNGTLGQRLQLPRPYEDDKPALLAFMDPGCGPCEALLPEIATWQSEYADRFRLIVISQGSAEANRLRAAKHGIYEVFVQTAREVSDAYHIGVTPSAVLLASNGRIASHTALGADNIRLLVTAIVDGHAGDVSESARRIAENSAGSHKLQVGDEAPGFTVRNLAGETVTLDFKGTRTVVVFWHPDCGFCQRLLPELKSWEQHPSNAVRLVVVSAGSTASNQAMGFKASVFLDDALNVGGAFGVPGTPSALLIDEAGKVASEVAVGADPVLQLVRIPIAASVTLHPPLASYTG
jgi:thiol-disulfide isomerase/thioredoxin/uncharacterized membrane protein YphA (DoxX/SURF4 family)